MCPEKERYDREDKRRLSYYEMIPGTENIVSVCEESLAQFLPVAEFFFLNINLPNLKISR